MLCITSTSGEFELVNPAFEKTLGYREQDFLARSFIDFVHPDDKVATQVELQQVSEANIDIIRQGDIGDYFYVVEQGEIGFYVDGNLVGSCKKGACFGELALLYNSIHLDYMVSKI